MSNKNTSLSARKIETYRTRGFVSVRGCFSADDVAHWNAECERLWSSVPVDGSDARVQWRRHQAEGRIADRLDPVMDISPVFDALCRDDRLTSPARAVIGGDVTIFKGKLIMKRPGTMGYDLHQDYPYWEFMGIPAEHIVVAVVPIDTWDAASGAIEFFPGYHHARVPAAPGGDPYDTDPSRIDLDSGVIVALDPGDVVLFHPLTPHQSGPNTADHGRRALYYTFVRSEHHGALERYYAERPDPISD